MWPASSAKPLSLPHVLQPPPELGAAYACLRAAPDPLTIANAVSSDCLPAIDGPSPRARWPDYGPLAPSRTPCFAWLLVPLASPLTLAATPALTCCAPNWPSRPTYCANGPSLPSKSAHQTRSTHGLAARSPSTLALPIYTYCGIPGASRLTGDGRKLILTEVERPWEWAIAYRCQAGGVSDSTHRSVVRWGRGIGRAAVLRGPSCGE
jgi:hypothetical protein